MSDRVPSPAVLDATVLSNLASTDAVGLVATLPRPVTVPAVAEELRSGLEEGYGFLGTAVEQLGGDVPVVDPPPSLPGELARGLDAGEAEVLHLASNREGTVVSDDRDARRFARRRGVDVTGSLGVLARAVVYDEITVETADEWLGTWRTEHGYRSPVESVSEVLQDGSRSGADDHRGSIVPERTGRQDVTRPAVRSRPAGSSGPPGRASGTRTPGTP